MKLIYNNLIFVSILLISSNGWGQNIFAESKLDTNSILIGEQVELEYTVQYSNEKDQVEFPLFMDTISKNIEIIEVNPIAAAVLRNSLLFITFNLWILKIPSH